MSWLERQAHGRTEAEVTREHGRYIRASGLDRALDALSGPFGVRRFIVRFERQGGRVRVTRIVAVPLPAGGGPPPADPTGDRLARVERALTALHANMATGPRWDRGAVGYLRDGQGHSSLLPLFDDDADLADIDALPMPSGSHPLEAPQSRALFARWEPTMTRIQARTAAMATDWDEWDIQDDRRLHLAYADDPSRDRVFACRTLATFEPRWRRFTWRSDGALFEEALFQESWFAADLAAATEIALLACARLDADWLFNGELDERGTLLFAAVRR